MSTRSSAVEQLTFNRLVTGSIPVGCTTRRRKCKECNQDWADFPSRLCPGCKAYQEHLK